MKTKIKKEGRIKNIQGVTLTELLVSSILMGIVMLGVVAMNTGLKSISTRSNQTNLMAMRGSAVMSEITRYGLQAIGSSGNPGIRFTPLPPATVTPNSTQLYYFSFRQPNLPNTAPLPVPQNNSDRWFIYTNARIANALFVCTQMNSDGQQYRGYLPNLNTSCNAANRTQLLNNVAAITYGLEPDAQFPSSYYFYIEIETRLYPRLSYDPITNPHNIIKTRISPPNHSWTN